MRTGGVLGVRRYLPRLRDRWAEPWSMVTPERLLARNDGKQKVGGAASSGVNHVRPGVVVRAVMRVGKTAHAVAGLDVEPDSMAFREHHAGRPDFHVDANHFMGLQPLAAFMRMGLAMGHTEGRVEPAVRGASCASAPSTSAPRLPATGSR